MNKKIEVLFDEKKIAKRVKEIGSQIDKDFPDGDLVVIGVLKGSLLFMADLIRAIKRPLRCDFLRVSSYQNDQDTGVIRMEFDITQSIEGKHVLLVEDIVDSGKTLKHLIAHIKTKDPASLKVASLLYKDRGIDNRKLVDYLGFDVPDRYVVGYGLDSQGLYRSLPYIGVIDN
ncbi:MAG: hypoxanthine phosphoribosyltransferase [Pseudomonadota bacterium]